MINMKIVAEKTGGRKNELYHQQRISQGVLTRSLIGRGDEYQGGVPGDGEGSKSRDEERD